MYYQQQIQPQLSPYQTSYQPMQNPYLAQIGQNQQGLQGAQFPSQNQQTVQSGIAGKIVNDVSIVSPNDVPMDGSVAFFPKSDLTEIYCKQWTSNGTIQTVVYRPIQPENLEQSGNIPQTDFNALNEDVRALRQEISERFDRLERSMTNSKTKAPVSRAKKEEAE